MNKRREEILSVIPKCNALCDVGCDHGYVGLECLLRGIAQNVVFSDISEPSLQKARNLLQQHENLACRAEFCVANGLCGVDVESLDACVIAGMGGEEIMKILAGDSPKICVLQPMSEVEKLRVFLSGRFEICKDRLFYDRGKYYNLIVAKRGEKSNLSEFEIMFGKTNLEAPSADFLKFALARRDRQLQIERNRSVKDDEDKKIINFLNELLSRYGGNENIGNNN